MKFSLQRCSYSISFSYLSENEVAQPCPTLCDLMDRKPPGPLCMAVSRQEYWSGLLFSSPRDLPDLEIEPRSTALQADSTT